MLDSLSVPVGNLIVGLGIPSCGKSSVFTELARMHRLKVFCEPEENDWPQAVHERETCGFFTAITWFRSKRVPGLFAAASLRASGRVVLVDSYYDKLFRYWLGKPGMDWLIPSSDSYFSITKRMADLDAKKLPNADTIVFFDVSRKVWNHFISKRGRQLDQHPGFRESFRTQSYFRDAAKEFSSASGAKLIIFKQEISTIDKAAAALSGELRRNGVQLKQHANVRSGGDKKRWR